MVSAIKNRAQYNVLGKVAVRNRGGILSLYSKGLTGILAPEFSRTRQI